MKIDWVHSIIAVCVAALVAYGFYEWASNEETRTLLGIVSFLLLSLTSVLAFGVKLDESRVSTMFQTLSMVWLVLLFVLNLIFSFCNFSVPLFIILNGIVTLLYAGIAVTVFRAQ